MAFQPFFPILSQTDEPKGVFLMNAEQEQGQRMILVIDDEAPVREAVEDVLDLIGVEVLTAENGRVGIAIFQKRMAEIDLILLDLSMPGLSGQETLDKLRQLDSEVKVILSSGYSAEEMMVTDDEITAFLQKPYDVDKLLKQVNHFLL